MKVYIGSDRNEEIGYLCKTHAELMIPSGFELIENIDECDIFISILYDKIIDQSFIDSKERCVNFHPGLLPGYRGSGAYSWVLLNREEETGITVHEIDYNIDSGPIIDTRTTLIYPKDTAGTLFDRCMKLLYSAFCDNFYDILYGSYATYPNHGGKIYLRKQLKEAKDITNIVKAFTFPDKENCYYYNKENEKIYIQWETS